MFGTTGAFACVTGHANPTSTAPRPTRTGDSTIGGGLGGAGLAKCAGTVISRVWGVLKKLSMVRILVSVWK